MLPGLINASKQVRHETQLIFFKENDFEITPQVLKERSDAPLLSTRTMHRNVGLELRSVRVFLEVKKRFDSELFQLKGSFTLSLNGGNLAISNEVYSGTYIGRSSPSRAPPGLNVCGCDIEDLVRWYDRNTGSKDIVDFLRVLKRRNVHRCGSYHAADLSRRDEVIYRGRFCEECLRRGWSMVYF